MSAQQFLMDQLGRMERVIGGADYFRDNTPSQTESGNSRLKRTVTDQSGKVRTTPEVPKPQNPNASAASRARTPKVKPNPYAAKPTGLTTPSGPNPMEYVKNLMGLTNMTVGGAVAAPLVLGGSEDASRKWSRLGYSSPEAYQKAISENAHRNRPLGSDNSVPSPTNNKPNNASEINARLAQQKKEKEAALARTKGNYDHSSGSYTGQDVALVPDSTLNTDNGGGGGNRNSERTNANGIVQKGTDMGRSFNDLLAAQKTTQYNAFSSNQLPTTPANPFEVTAPKTQSFDAAAPGVTGNSIADFGGDESAAFASSRERTDRDTFNPDAARIEGGSSRKPGGSLDEALADTAGINSYMSKFSSGDRERAARSAFLSDTDSMTALQRRDAVNGVVYAGGQHYVSGKSGDDTAVKIDRSVARDISSGKETASGASQKALDFLAKKKAEVTAAAKQEPTILENAASSQAFQQDKPMSATMPGNFVGSVDFISNNDNIVKPFGGPKGYSSGFKRIDTSMPNPFGG